jgi:hypothetical protein
MNIVLRSNIMKNMITFVFSFIKSSSIVKFYTSNHCSMLGEQINCLNRYNNQKNDDHHQVSMHVQSKKDKKRRQFDMPKSKNCRLFSLPIMVIDVFLIL